MYKIESQLQMRSITGTSKLIYNNEHLSYFKDWRLFSVLI